jgi:hypothetical protein
MFCSKCETNNPDTGRFCLSCGSSLEVPPILPGQPPVPGLAPPSFGEPETSGKAIASLICGVCFFIFPAAVAAIILGHLSISDVNRSLGRLKGRGMATAGLVLGYGGVLFIPFILIVAAIAIPNLIRARTVANQASAAASLRTIVAAASIYESEYSNGYPPTLAAMDGVGIGNGSCDHAQLIDSRLASGLKAGYRFTYTAAFSDASPSESLPKPSADAAAKGCTVGGGSAFTVTAVPASAETGSASYFVDQTAIIRVEKRGYPATADSPPLDGSDSF